MDQFIVFSNKDQKFAIDISMIDRIIEFDKPKKIPESSAYLLGVIQFNEKILPIIDLTKKLYNQEALLDHNNKVIVVLWKNKQLGLVVDDILGIYSFEDSQYEKSNNEIQISKEYVVGFIKTKDDITIVLDIDKLFSREQEKELLLSDDYQGI